MKLKKVGINYSKKTSASLKKLTQNWGSSKVVDLYLDRCQVDNLDKKQLLIRDDGHGMTLDDFQNGWMRIGTSSKNEISLSKNFCRLVTGEKGIGRFAVRFLGKKLHLESVAYDSKRKFDTLLIADFDWPTFDQSEDLGTITVPYMQSPRQLLRECDIFFHPACLPRSVVE